MPAIKDALIEARGLVERGWIKGVSEFNGRYCMLEACRMAVAGDAWMINRVIETLQDKIPAFYQDRINPMTSFNDAFETRHEDVLRVFDEAIASC